MPTAVSTDHRPKSVQRTSTPVRTPPGQTSRPQLDYSPNLLKLPRPAQPLGLRLLVKLRQVSTPVALVMVMGVLPLYGWSVLTQRSWGKGYNHLQQLRRDENALINKTETQKHDITAHIESHPDGLVPQGPTNTLLLPSQPPRPRANPSDAAPSQRSAVVFPLAY